MTTSTTTSPARRRLLALVAGGLAGLLAGVDAILVVFLLAMLGGSNADDLVIPALGHAGWSASRGVEVGLDPGGFVILLAAMGAGALLARHFVPGRRPGLGLGSPPRPRAAA
jgi:hypothetical protein